MLLHYVFFSVRFISYFAKFYSTLSLDLALGFDFCSRHLWFDLQLFFLRFYNLPLHPWFTFNSDFHNGHAPFDVDFLCITTQAMLICYLNQFLFFSWSFFSLCVCAFQSMSMYVCLCVPVCESMQSNTYVHAIFLFFFIETPIEKQNNKAVDSKELTIKEQPV